MAGSGADGLNSATDRSMRSVFVGNIPYEATEEILKDVFSQVGPVISFRLVYDRESGKPKGYGFCEYKDQETALSCMRNLNGYELNGRPLRVDNASSEKSKEELKSLQSSLGAQHTESPYGPEVPPEKAPEAVKNVMASLCPEYLNEFLVEMKEYYKNCPEQATAFLEQNPQIVFGMIHGLVRVGSLDVMTATLWARHLVPGTPIQPAHFFPNQAVYQGGAASSTQGTGTPSSVSERTNALLSSVLNAPARTQPDPVSSFFDSGQSGIRHSTDLSIQHQWPERGMNMRSRELFPPPLIDFDPPPSTIRHDVADVQHSVMGHEFRRSTARCELPGSRSFNDLRCQNIPGIGPEAGPNNQPSFGIPKPQSIPGLDFDNYPNRSGSLCERQESQHIPGLTPNVSPRKQSSPFDRSGVVSPNRRWPSLDRQLFQSSLPADKRPGLDDRRGGIQHSFEDLRKSNIPSVSSGNILPNLPMASASSSHFRGTSTCSRFIPQSDNNFLPAVAAMTPKSPDKSPIRAPAGSGSSQIRGAAASSSSIPQPDPNSHATVTPSTEPNREEKARLIMQVLQLTDQQLAALPEEQRQNIMILKNQISQFL